MENKEKEYVVTEVSENDIHDSLENPENTNSDLKRKSITALIAGAVGVAGIAGSYFLQKANIRNIFSILTSVIGFAGTFVSFDSFYKVMDAILDKIIKKSIIREEAKLKSELIKYNIERDEYEKYICAVRNHIPPQEYKYLMDSGITVEKYNELQNRGISPYYFMELEGKNISLDEYQGLRNLEIAVDDYSKYKNEQMPTVTPNEYFVKTIDDEMPKGKTIAVAAIIAGVGAIGTVAGAIGNMTISDVDLAIGSGVIGLGSMLPMITGSLLTIEGILIKSKLSKTYTEITGQPYKKKEKVRSL